MRKEALLLVFSEFSSIIFLDSVQQAQVFQGKGKFFLFTQIKLLDTDKYNTVTTNSCTRCVTQFSSRNAATLGASRKILYITHHYYTDVACVKSFLLHRTETNMAAKTMIAYLLCGLKNSLDKSSFISQSSSLQLSLG